MQQPPQQSFSFWLRRLREGKSWAANIPIVLMTVGGGLWLLERDLGQNWSSFYKDAETGEIAVTAQLLPLVLLGAGLAIVSLGLLFRSRLAWIMTVLLASGAIVSTILGRAHIQFDLLLYLSLTLGVLIFFWRRFDRASLAASTLFALTAIAALLFYGTFGSFYIGQQFRPPITDLITAFYYAMVTMTTVGYGDITPNTSEARLFSISVIVFGVAIFATALTAVISPLVSNSINRIVLNKDRHMERRNHFIVIGNSALAINTSRELIKRGKTVTRILKQTPDDSMQQGEFDILIGDGSSLAVLREAGAGQAQCVLAMKTDDSENAFIVLAVRELGANVKTVIAVNDTSHMERIRLVQPDIILAPEVFGGELIAMQLSGETVTPEFVMDRIFQRSEAKSSG